ncbi:hypothetical protein GCM10027059_37390 [Myceligenerans halotolerans]
MHLECAVRVVRRLALDVRDRALRVVPDMLDRVVVRRVRRELPREDVRALRQIKNLLTPALELADRLGDDRLLGWAEAYRALP